MNYSIFKLNFTAPVHFGTSDSALSLEKSEMNFCADTLFSALVHEAVSLKGESGAERILSMAREGRILLSDAFPFFEQGEKTEYYLPKPYILSDAEKEIPEDLRKKIKKLQWIPVSSFNRFSDSVKGGEIYRPQEDFNPGIFSYDVRANIDRDTGIATPYNVSNFTFHDGYGLYFILGSANQEDLGWIENLIQSLGLRGIGGKVSSGYGMFYLSERIDLDSSKQAALQFFNQALGSDHKRYMLLTTSLPKDEELAHALDGAFYQLKRRGGFTQSGRSGDLIRKKQTQYFLCSGSTLKNPFKGELWEIGDSGSHRIYRYSIPIMMGVDF